MQKYQTLIIQDDLKYPEKYHEDVIRFSQTKLALDEVGVNRQENPFSRYVDLWFLSVCLGAQSPDPVVLPVSEMHKFHDGSILTRDPWRIDMLAALAIGYSENPEIIETPKAVISLANSLAATGMPLVIDMLNDSLEIPGFSTPIWKLSRRMNVMLSDLGN